MRPISLLAGAARQPCVWRRGSRHGGRRVNGAAARSGACAAQGQRSNRTGPRKAGCVDPAGLARSALAVASGSTRTCSPRPAVASLLDSASAGRDRRLRLAWRRLARLRLALPCTACPPRRRWTARGGESVGCGLDSPGPVCSGPRARLLRASGLSARGLSARSVPAPARLLQAPPPLRACPLQACPLQASPLQAGQRQARRPQPRSFQTSSASCTALVAAPLRMLSATTHSDSPRGCEMSSRMRPTNTGSWPEAWVTGVG